jgi:alkanesulfonate monooxygenase SsuD/methylene tetrahydromethanopterin reductase-like flavin-dependent oxidoreductase (luciferase family)
VTSAFALGVRLVPSGWDAAAIAACVALGRRAEAIGLDWVAVAERFDGQGGVPAALPICAALAAETGRVRIATALLPLPLHHPLRVAEEAATVDVLAAGRLELGIGAGAPEAPFAGFGLDGGERAERFAEALAILRGAFGEGPVSYQGRHFRCDAVSVYPKPVQPGGPPLWIGARTPQGLARAAELGAGALVEIDVDPAPYLRAAGAAARVALLAAPHVTPSALAQRLQRSRGAAQGVCLIDVRDEADLAAAQRVADALLRIA